MKKILSYFSLLFVFALSLNSCRTNELVENEVKQKEKIGAFVRFENKIKTYKTSEINYNEPFAELINFYLDNHPAYKTSLTNNLGTIDLNMSSQTMGDAEKYVLFPIKNNQNSITEVLIAKVNENRDFVQFRQLLDTETKNSIISAFQSAANKTNINSKEKTGDIQEVVIIIPKVKFVQQVEISFLPYYPPTQPEDMDGGAPEYGGGATDNPDETVQNDPCSKTKNLTQSTVIQDKINTLKEKAKTIGEQGFNIDLNGNPSTIINGGDHDVNLGDEKGQQGGYHNHTPTGIKMHSIPDILKLFNYAMNFNNGNIGDAFFGMTGAKFCNTCVGKYKYYNYIIRFNGTYQELVNLVYKNWDKSALLKDYIKMHQNLQNQSINFDSQTEDLNNLGLEKLFFETLKNMNIENKIILQRIDENGTIQNITFENNTPKATPCS